MTAHLVKGKHNPECCCLYLIKACPLPRDTLPAKRTGVCTPRTHQDQDLSTKEISLPQKRWGIGDKEEERKKERGGGMKRERGRNVRQRDKGLPLGGGDRWDI